MPLKAVPRNAPIRFKNKIYVSFPKESKSKWLPVHVALRHWIADVREVINPTDAESAVESILFGRVIGS